MPFLIMKMKIQCVSERKSYINAQQISSVMVFRHAQAEDFKTNMRIELELLSTCLAP